MEKLSIEEKAKAYDEAKARMSRAFNSNRCTFGFMNEIFPELKESEDERIRKELLEHCKNQAEPYIQTGNKCPQIQSWIDWLEKQNSNVDNANKEYWRGYREGKQEILDKYAELKKQGEQKPADKNEPKFKVGDWIVSDCGNVAYIESIGETKYNLQCKDGSHEKMSIDYVDRCWHSWTIQDAKDGDVLYMDNGLSTCTFIYKSIDNVIIQKYASYNKFGFEGTTYLVLNDGYVCPATKEQRDLLFQKMEEAGYEWDADKKELKMVNWNKHIKYNPNAPSIIKENPAWSEEDEVMIKVFDSIIRYIVEVVDKDALERFGTNREELFSWLKSLKDRIQPQSKQEWSEEEQVSEEFINALGTMLNDGLPDRYLVSEERIKKSAELLFSIARKQLKNEMQEWSEEDREMFGYALDMIEWYVGKNENKVRLVSDWFKSLKQRYTWKPSIAQLNALSIVSKGNAPDDIEAIVSLYNDLKKLKGE